MIVLEILVKMVEPVEMKLVDIPVNVRLDLLVKRVKQVGHYSNLVAWCFEFIEIDCNGTMCK